MLEDKFLYGIGTLIIFGFVGWEMRSFGRQKGLPTIIKGKTSNGGQRRDAIYPDGSLVQLRPQGRSGHSKIEITDQGLKIREKVTFIE